MTCTEETEYIKLRIDLQDGFDNDSVVVFLGETEIFRKDKITTDLSISLADNFKVDIKKGKYSLRVEIPTRMVSRSKDYDIQTDLFIGVSLKHQMIDFIDSTKELKYY